MGSTDYQLENRLPNYKNHTYGEADHDEQTAFAVIDRRGEAGSRVLPRNPSKAVDKILGTTTIQLSRYLRDSIPI